MPPDLRLSDRRCLARRASHCSTADQIVEQRLANGTGAIQFVAVELLAPGGVAEGRGRVRGALQ